MRLRRRPRLDLVGLLCPVCKTVESWKSGHIMCNGGQPYTRYHEIALMELIMVNEKGELTT